jgi:PGF-CTERM protein
VTVGGEPLDDDETYTVAVNSFMASGGSSYPFEDATVLNETGVLYGESVIDYMEARDTVSPEIEGRMRRVDASVGTVDRAIDPDADRATVSVALPERVQAVNASSVYLLDANNTRVDPVTATHDTGTLNATFATDELLGLGENVDLYAGYNDTQFAEQRVYFEGSVLNADVNVSRSETTTTATPTETPQEIQTTQPGFGSGVAVIAIIAAALVFARRRTIE